MLSDLTLLQITLNNFKNIWHLIFKVRNVITKPLSQISIKPYRFAQNADGNSKAASEIATGSSVIGSSCAR
jgi:hypothetical protein